MIGNATKLTLNDLRRIQAHCGYFAPEGLKIDPGLMDAQYVGVNKDKDHTYIAYGLDTNTGRYFVYSLFISLGRDGELCVDWAGSPLVEGVAEHEHIRIHWHYQCHIARMNFKTI